MSKGVALIAGYGTGVSHAVASKFGSQGFKLALVSRTQAKLDAAATEFSKHGIAAKGFSADLGKEASVKAAVSNIRADLGPPTVIFWNPYGAIIPLMSVTQEQLVHEFNVGVSGLVSAVQASYGDLKSQAGTSAILVTGGGIGVENDMITKLAVNWGALTLCTSKAAQRKLVDYLAKQLVPEGIYVHTVSISGNIKGTKLDDGTATITPEAISDKFWEAYEARDPAVWSTPIF